MSSEMVNAVKELAEAIRISGKKKTKGYDTTAEVKRIEGRTAWVHIPGGVDETPVLMTINAKAGDSVQVRVSGGRAWIIGNGTAPPTDDTKANQAFAYAMQAEKKAGRVVKMAEDGEFDGKDGADGNEVVAVYPQWCFSTSNSQFVKATGYDWQDTIPTYVSGLYYWTRTVTEYADGTVTYGDPVFDASAQASAEAVEAADTAGEAAETAQGIAEDALAVAGEKKRVFNAQPSPPYDLGDIWFDGGHGLTKKCIYARDDDESYDASDWEVINDTSYYFWYDSSGAHVSTVQGSVATGNSQTITPYGTVIMQNGKLVSSWTGSTYSDAALNFYDCTSGTLTYDSTHKITETVNGQPYEFSQPYSGQDGNLMASFNRCGVLLFANNKKMMSLTPSGLVFYQNDANSTKMAEYLSSGINLYASGQKKVGITSSGMSFYYTDSNSVLWTLAEYTGSNIKLYHPGTNTAAVTISPSGASFTGSITADSGQIGGWTIGSGKIYAGDSTTKVAVVQKPASSIDWVFGAGGSSHSSYGDCPFRVHKDGSLYSTSGVIGGWTISSTKLTRTATGHGTVDLDSDGMSVSYNSYVSSFGSYGASIQYGGWTTEYLRNSIYCQGSNSDISPLSWNTSNLNTSIGSGNETYIYNGYGEGVFVSNNDNFRPIHDNESWCGTDSGRWKGVYALNTTIQGSDRKLKDNIESLEFHKELIMSLEPITYMWKDGDHRRKRMGFVAQDVAEACKNINQNLFLVTASYKRDGDMVDNDYFGEDVDDELLTWGMSVEQLIAPLVALIQEQERRITQLERQVSA